MITKHNLIAGGVIALLTAGALFTVGQKTLPKSRTDLNPKQWLRLGPGSNELDRTQGNETYPTQHNQMSQPVVPAEIIGRTGYPLYP